MNKVVAAQVGGSGKVHASMFVRGTMVRLPPAIDEGTSLAEMGFAVDCFALHEDGLPVQEEIVPGFVIHRKRLVTSRLPFWKIFIPLRYSEYLLRTVWVSLSKRPSICIAHDLPAFLPAYIAGKLRRSPVVFRAHELWMGGGEERVFYWKYLEKYAWQHVDAVVLPNQERAEFWKEKYGDRRNVHVAMNVPSLSGPGRSSRLQEFLGAKGVLRKDAKIALYAGALSRDRSIGEIVDAIRLLPDNIFLIIMGWGAEPYFSELRLKTSEPEMAGRVFLHPQVPYGQVMDYLQSSDVGIALYQPVEMNAYLCAPHKVFDYLMAGKPVVVSDLPPLRKLIETEDVGICVNPIDPADIANGILYLLSDESRYERMRNNALRIAREKYNWQIEFSKLHGLYKRLLEGTA